MTTNHHDPRLTAMSAELQRQDEDLARMKAIAAARGDDDEIRFAIEGLEERIGAFVEATSVLRPAMPSRGVRV